MEPEGVSRASRRRIAMRRGVVIALLLVCVLMLTSFFREGEDGFLHSVKGTVTDVANPIQGAASAAVSPVRNLVGWIRDARSAANERDRLREQVQGLQAEMTRLQNNQLTSDEYRKQWAGRLDLERDPTLAGNYTFTSASIRTRAPYETRQWVRIDKGSGDGITVNSLAFAPGQVVEGQPIVGALVGRVTRVDRNSAEVTFITDTSQPVAASLLDGTSVLKLGLLRANPNGDLTLNDVPAKYSIDLNSRVVTLGASVNARLESPYPPGLLIGYVSNVGRANANSTWTLQVTPMVNPQELRSLTILVPKSAEAKRRARS